MAGVFLQTIFDEVRQALDGGDTELAIAIAQHILQHAPQVIEGHRLLGEAHLNAAQFASASGAFAAVLRADPEHIAAYYGLGLAQRSLGQTGAAIQSLERALEIQPNLAELRTQLLQLYAETPNSAGQFRLSRSGLGRLYARGQMYSQAIDEFRAVLDNEPDRDDVRVALAEALWRAGQEDAATEWCRLVTETDPELFKPTLIGGYLQLAAGQPEGETLWRRAAAQEPGLATAEALFEILPPLHVDEPVIPAFDEEAWRAMGAASTVAEPPTESAGTDLIADVEVVAVEELDSATGQSDDDLLASLLGFGGGDGLIASASTAELPSAADAETASADVSTGPMVAVGQVHTDSRRGSGARTYLVPEVLGNELSQAPSPTVEHMSQAQDQTGLVIEPVSNEPDGLDLPGADAQPFPMYGRSSGDPRSFGRVEPFRLEDWDVPVSSTAQASPGSAAASNATPVSMSQAQPSDAFGDIKPFSLDDLIDAPTDEDMQATPGEVSTDKDEHRPFSLRELGLEQNDAEGEGTQAGAPQSSPPQARDTVSFSLRELGLSPDDVADAAPNDQASANPTTGVSRSPTRADDSSTTPRADLGLSDEELAQWETQREGDDVPWNDASFYSANTVNREPVTPFSLADLGLTDEELERWNADASAPSGGLPAADEEETTPFFLTDYEPSTSPARSDAPPQAQPPAAPASIHTAETQPFDVSALLAEADATDEAHASGPEGGPTASDDAQAGSSDAGQTVVDDEEPPPESPILRRFHERLAVEPDNHALRLGLARANVQQNNIAQALEQYKQLVQRSVLIEPILEDLSDLLESTEDRPTLRRLHRLLGDVYMGQGRMDEALTEYSWT